MAEMMLDSVEFQWDVGKGFTSMSSNILLSSQSPANVKGSLKALEAAVERAIGSWKAKQPTGSCSNRQLKAGFIYELSDFLERIDLDYTITMPGPACAIRCYHKDRDTERILRVHDALTGIDGLGRSTRAVLDLDMIAKLRSSDVASYERLLMT